MDLDKLVLGLRPVLGLELHAAFPSVRRLGALGFLPPPLAQSVERALLAERLNLLEPGLVLRVFLIPSVLFGKALQLLQLVELPAQDVVVVCSL